MVFIGGNGRADKTRKADIFAKKVYACTGKRTIRQAEPGGDSSVTMRCYKILFSAAMRNISARLRAPSLL